jgi:hypothetical protein
MSYILVSWLVSYLVTPTKFSDVGFCPTKFKLCPTKIKSDRTNVLSSQIFICSPDHTCLSMLHCEVFSYHFKSIYYKHHHFVTNENNYLTLNDWAWTLYMYIQYTTSGWVFFNYPTYPVSNSNMIWPSDYCT